MSDTNDIECIQLFPYEDADEWSKRYAFAYVDQDESDEQSFDDWDYEMLSSWFAVTERGWTLQESLEEAIIEAFDMLDIPFDEQDVDLLYGLQTEVPEPW